jgi:microcystin-dependent protein
MFCEGQLLAISEYDVLFQLIGTTYGGDGVSTFALPDLRGRVPIHQGAGFVQGQTGGQETVALAVAQNPPHNHSLVASSTAAAAVAPATRILSKTAGYTPYVNDATPNTPLALTSITARGGLQPHDNLQPYLCVSFIISLFGIFPSPT